MSKQIYRQKIVYRLPDGRDLFARRGIGGALWFAMYAPAQDPPVPAEERSAHRFRSPMCPERETAEEVREDIDRYIGSKQCSAGERWYRVSYIVCGVPLTYQEWCRMHRGELALDDVRRVAEQAKKSDRTTNEKESRQMSKMELDVMVNHKVRESRLAQVEERIAAHMNRAGEELVEVGRCLNEAKEQGLVPHGKWEAWVREQTGMSERTAQRWMQAAREIPAGSPIARMGAAKISALLTIAPAEREAFAEQIGAEAATSRDVQAAVQAAKRERDQMRRELDEALRQTGALKRKAQEAEQEAVQSAKRLDDLQMRLAQERNAADERLRDAGAELARLRDELQAAKARAAQPAGGISPEAQSRIDALERELDDALTRYDDAQDQIAQLERRKGGAAQADGMTMDAVRAAIGAFMAAAGGLPQMLERQSVTQSEAAVLRGQAAMVGEWAQRVLAAVRG